jgi:holliday junction DNA helicase RuvA
MIEFIKGKLISKKPAMAVIEAGGIGYGINITISAAESLPAIGEEANIVTHLQIRDNPFSVMLYGFCNEVERECFRQIISVSGIGPKTALGILSAINYNELIELIAKGNYLPLTSIPGVGRKTAERLALELKDKLGKTDADSTLVSVNSDKFNELNKASEVIQALIALGYNRMEADKMVRGISSKPGFMEMKPEEVIREILRGK